MQYVISDNYSLNVRNDWTISYMDLNIIVAILAGSSFIKMKGNAALMSQPNGEVWFIPDAAMLEEERNAIDMKSYVPSVDQMFLQTIMAKYPMVINPVVSRNGYLLGWWRCDSMTRLSSALSDDDFRSGILSGINEPVFNEGASFHSVICQNALMQAGFKKKAVFIFDDVSTNPKLLFLSDNSIEVLKRNQLMNALMVLSPELDKYALIPSKAYNDDKYIEHEENARSVCNIQKMDYERGLIIGEDMLD